MQDALMCSDTVGWVTERASGLSKLLLLIPTPLDGG